MNFLEFGPQQSNINSGISLRFDRYYKGQRLAQANCSGSTEEFPIIIAEPMEVEPTSEQLIPRLITFEHQWVQESEEIQY